MKRNIWKILAPCIAQTSGGVWEGGRFLRHTEAQRIDALWHTLAAAVWKIHQSAAVSAERRAGGRRPARAHTQRGARIRTYKSSHETEFQDSRAQSPNV
eukprot:3656054-Prymnesium_polylepis.1